MDDLTKLTDEELDQAIESGSELDQSPSEPTTEEVVEDTTEEVAEEAAAVEEAEPAEEQGAEEAPQQPSRRENLRIQQVLERLKQQPKAPEAPQPAEGLDYGTALDADPEVIQQLQADRQAASQTAYNQGLEQAKSIQFHTRLEIDAPKVESKFSQLNPEDKENFNPALANAVNTWYLSTAGYDQASDTVANPNIRYAEFVESVMELGEVIGAQKAQRSVQNIAKQAATTGLRPDGSQAKRLDLNKSPDAMSDEELDAFLKQAGVHTR
jgi:hypothetical protein